MESISVETDWERLGFSTLSNTERSNYSSLFVSELNSFNASHSGGSLFGVLAENGSNTTTHILPKPRIRDPSLAQAEITVLGLVLALTTLGNGFVLWVLLRRRKHNAPMHLFMVNLCVADLVVGFFQVLPQLIWDITGKFRGPDFLCRSVKYLQIVGMFASSYMIVAMTVDRHRAICCPLQAYRVGAMSRWNTPVMVAWFLALLFSIPQVFIFSRTEVTPGEFECWGQFTEPWGLKAYITWMTMVVFLLPALIITVCQIRIFCEIHNNIYLKSERVVMAEVKKSDILFRFHSFKKDAKQTHSSGGVGVDESEGQLLRTVNNNPHNDVSSGRVGECCDCAPSSLQYRNCCGEHTTETTTTSSPMRQQMLNSSNFQEPHTNSPRCSLDYIPAHPPLTPTPSITKAMTKTIRMTLVIVLVYTICWSPFFIVQMWGAWDPNAPNEGVAFTILMLLASLNSCTNPWIYTAFSSSVSKELQNLLHCRTRLGRRGSVHDDSTTTHTITTKDIPY